MGSKRSSTLFEGLPRGMGSSAEAFAVRLRGGMAFVQLVDIFRRAASRRLAASRRGYSGLAPAARETQ